MSYNDGWAALNMEMPERIPRTEYSVHEHWKLLSKITGRTVTAETPEADRRRAKQEFFKAWNFGLRWSILLHRQGFEKGRRTLMGHAEYADGGSDWDDDVSCPFENPEECLKFDPVEEYGVVAKRVAQAAFEQHYRDNCSAFDDCVNMSGIYVTLFSGLIEIFGWDMMLMAGGTDPEAFGAMAQRYERWIRPYFEAFADSDVPVMMCHDDITWTSGPVFPPQWYREYIFPAYRRLWQPVLDSGKKLIYTSDGDYTMFFDDIVDAGAHALVMEPCSDMALFAGKYGKTHAFIGNADTKILLKGDQKEIREEVERCINIGKDCPGFFMAVGNHIPANTPIESAIYYNQVYEELSRR